MNITRFTVGLHVSMNVDGSRMESIGTEIQAQINSKNSHLQSLCKTVANRKKRSFNSNAEYLQRIDKKIHNFPDNPVYSIQDNNDSIYDEIADVERTYNDFQSNGTHSQPGQTQVRFQGHSKLLYVQQNYFYQTASYIPFLMHNYYAQKYTYILIHISKYLSSYLVHYIQYRLKLLVPCTHMHADLVSEFITMDM